MRLKNEEKLEYINLWKESGLSKIEFCKKMGLPYQGFIRWNKKIFIDQNKAIDTQKTRIVPVKIIQDVHKNIDQTCIILYLQSCSIKIMPGFPQSELKHILELLDK